MVVGGGGEEGLFPEKLFLILRNERRALVLEHAPGYRNVSRKSRRRTVGTGSQRWT